MSGCCVGFDRRRERDSRQWKLSRWMLSELKGEAFVLRLEDEADSCVLEADSFQLSEGKPEDP